MTPRTILPVCLIIIGSGIGLHAQTYQVATIGSDNDRWVLVKDFPKERLLKGYIGYRFYAPPCEDANQIELYGETKKGELVYIKNWKDKCVYYPEKSERIATYSEEKGIVIHSEISYKSASIDCIFRLKGNNIEFSGIDLKDANADWVFKGDSLLISGDVEGALEAFAKVFQPSNYMNMTAKGIEILEEAHPQAWEAAENGDFEKAARLMGKALDFTGIWMLAGDAFVSGTDLDKYEKELWKQDSPIRELLEMYTVDYGYFLQQSKKYAESIALNRYLANILPECASPCLYWADALYETGKTEQAKQPYRMYILRMKAQEREEEIEERAHKRAN